MIRKSDLTKQSELSHVGFNVNVALDFKRLILQVKASPLPVRHISLYCTYHNHFFFSTVWMQDDQAVLPPLALPCLCREKWASFHSPSKKKNINSSCCFIRIYEAHCSLLDDCYFFTPLLKSLKHLIKTCNGALAERLCKKKFVIKRISLA